ncbi:type IV toxin-antitoxin system AbiEi family antitoxin [Patulibacter sp. SYSU D01012]|uniref:type IV toxin-antitoxin system AbiEi family antitoxin n=1 Tax=Patulibacter sp. SYSU D01012 TaxID=2817381 RepID=UPI001B312A83|nr:type IV toxin-antitoxin system AbiEi family antitoxin [Patulibacter sp. SYSU D01012]
MEREAVRRLPGLLADLFDEPHIDTSCRVERADSGADLIIEAGGRRWFVQLKSSSSPGIVAAAAEQLQAQADPDVRGVLVVPFMTSAGARTADERRINWIDLSGNAHLRDDLLHIWVQGRPNAFPRPGRPASAFAPKSSRVARTLLLDPTRWWRQKDLSDSTDLDPGRVSRIIKRLAEGQLLERDGSLLRPRDPDLLLDAWAEEYRFDRHDIQTGHLTGTGLQLAQDVHDRLERAGVDHALTGLPAAYALDGFARFRLISVYVAGDPRDAADALELRRNDRGANVQLIGPDDRGVFDGSGNVDGLPCVAPVQVYLDLLHLPERAAEAAQELRAGNSLWRRSV